jgi:DHA2 family multidrug resistance protein
MMQGLLNYPVVRTGVLIAPRGLGGLIAMMAVATFAGKVDPRTFMGLGFAITALSLWQMTGFDLQMGVESITTSSVIQGLGTGMIYIPMSTTTFATLAPRLRNEATAFFSLIRNIGGSIGISVVQTLATRNTQALHAGLAGHITPFNDVLHLHSPQPLAPGTGLRILNEAVTNEAAMIAYDDNFKAMLILTLCVTPLLFLLRHSRANATTDPVVIE